MIRAIEFRAWDKAHKRFMYCVLTPNAKLITSPSNIICYAMNWEQSTDMKDKNGKRIYDGDVLKNTINDGLWRVYWNEKDAAFWVDSGVAGCSLGDFDWDRSNRKYGFIRKNCEVIGNIHESNIEELFSEECEE